MTENRFLIDLSEAQALVDEVRAMRYRLMERGRHLANDNPQRVHFNDAIEDMRSAELRLLGAMMKFAKSNGIVLRPEDAKEAE